MSGSMIPPTLFFIVKIAVAIQGLFWFHIIFWNICSTSVKYNIGILIWIALNLQIALGSIDILVKLIFLFLHTVNVSAYLCYFTFFLWCLIIIFWCLIKYRYFTFLVKLSLGVFLIHCTSHWFFFSFFLIVHYLCREMLLISGFLFLSCYFTKFIYQF